MSADTRLIDDTPLTITRNGAPRSLKGEKIIEGAGEGGGGGEEEEGRRERKRGRSEESGERENASNKFLARQRIMYIVQRMVDESRDTFYYKTTAMQINLSTHVPRGDERASVTPLSLI